MSQEGELEDINKPFIEKDWIGRGRIYNRTALPTFVIIAISKVIEMPPNVASTQLPKTNLSITDFLAFDLPRMSSELIPNRFVLCLLCCGRCLKDPQTFFPPILGSNSTQKHLCKGKGTGVGGVGWCTSVEFSSSSSWRLRVYCNG